MDDMKQCPFCSGEIKSAAVKCKHCGKMLDESVPTTEEPQPPESSEPETTTGEPSDESPQEPDKKSLNKVVIKSIQNDKARFAFGMQLHEKLKIPRAQLNDLLVPGKAIVKDLDMEQAQKMVEDLSMEGIELGINPQLSSEDKKYILAVVIMLISIIVGIWSMKFKVMDEPTYTDTKGEKKTTAEVMCKEIVKKNLKAPSTADFPWLAEKVTYLGDNTYEVTSYVEAENSFGVMIKTHYTCTVKSISKDKWRLINLETW